MKNGWQVAIDLTNQVECNLNIFNSPFFKTEKGARIWYEKLDFSTNEVNNLDFIMVHFVDNEMTDTYIL